jgi:hypothetical protein
MGTGILRQRHQKVINFIMFWKQVLICEKYGNCFARAERKRNTLTNWDLNTSNNPENAFSKSEKRHE